MTSAEQNGYPITQKLIEKYYENILGYSIAKDHDNSQGSDGSVTASTYVSEDGSRSKCSMVVGACNEYITRCRSYLYSVFIGDYEKDLLIQRLLSEKRHAMSYEEWKISSDKLDNLTNKNVWKKQVESPYYDYKLIERLTADLRDARLNRNYGQMVYLIRTNWVRNLGNMGNVNLYRHSHIGTKYLIDEYMNESTLSLESLLYNSDLDDAYLLGMLQQTRRNIGRTALVLSGGGTFGLFHIGVLSTLFELELLPRVISGSSAGAIIASILSVYYKEELPALLDRVLTTDFNIFKDDSLKSEGENLLIKISRFFKNGTWFDNKHLARTMVEFLGDLTFREAYNRTGKILNITVSPASLFEQPRLLNNLTAPNVLIWSAVCASCSLPGIFPSSPLYEKDPITLKTREWGGSSSVRFVDGSVDNDLPISRLSEMFNVDHIIACQVNIHVFPILKMSLSCVGGDIQDEFSAKVKQGLTTCYNFMANEAIHYLEMGCELGIATNTLTKLRSVLSQQYSGDITILPDMNMLLRINELLTNPTKEFILRETTNGARSAWPKISIIQNHCGQEFALEKAISFLKGKMLMSSTIRNPLQFSDVPVGLVKASIEKLQHQNDINKENSEKTLDDNLLETESTNSLLLLRENPHTYRRFSSAKFTTNGNKFRAQRRKSDSLPHSTFTGFSNSFVLTSPTAKSPREPRKYMTNRPGMNHRFSAEHLSHWREMKSGKNKDCKDYSRHDLSPTLRKRHSQLLTLPPHTEVVDSITSASSSPKSRRDMRLSRSHQSKTQSKNNIFYTESDNEENMSQKSLTPKDSLDINIPGTGVSINEITKKDRSSRRRSSIKNSNINLAHIENDIRSISSKIEYLGDVPSNNSENSPIN